MDNSPQRKTATSIIFWASSSVDVLLVFSKTLWETKFSTPKHLIHHHPHAMHVCITDLHEDRAGFGQKVTRHGQLVAQSEIRMFAVSPGVAKGFHLLQFTSDVPVVAVIDVAAGRGPMEVGIELDAVGRIEVNALHLAT